MTTIVVYASSTGNTKAVAEYIANKTKGTAVDVADAGSVDLGPYDTVVIGGRVRAGKLPKELVDYVLRNKEAISTKKTAFYDCCMYDKEKGQKQSDKLATELGIVNHIYITKGKKMVKGDTKKIDDFIASF